MNTSALKVLYQLKESNFQACLVGGGVRDLLLGLEPKDFDVATDAHPEEIKRLFRSCHLIGRRFRLAHVRFGRDIIEVATFRGHHALGEGQTEDKGRIIRDNVYGTLEEDAYRRDFTVNALYYNIKDFSIIDYVDGMSDLDNRLLRLIGDAEQRYREDPVRMLRAVRFAAKLDFAIHSESAEPITSLGALLNDIPAARLYEEVLKLFLSGHAVASYSSLMQYGLLKHLFPHVKRDASLNDGGLLLQALKNTDSRVANKQSVTPAFLFAALLWQPLQNKVKLRGHDENQHKVWHDAMNVVISEQLTCTLLPKRILRPMRDVWSLQSAFTKRRGKKALRFLGHASFRAAYDFLLLRIGAGLEDASLGDWWGKLQADHPEVVENAGHKTVHKRSRKQRSQNR